MVFGKENKEIRQGNIVKNCCDCKQEIVVRYNRGTKTYSKKNDGYEWTGNAENKGKYKCDNCLLTLYYDRPQDFLEIVLKSKKQLFGHYVNQEIIKR